MNGLSLVQINIRFNVCNYESIMVVLLQSWSYLFQQKQVILSFVAEEFLMTSYINTYRLGVDFSINIVIKKDKIIL